MKDYGITLDDIAAARRRIEDTVVQTPLLPSHSLCERTGAAVLLKLDFLQATGSFKLRGACNAIKALDARQRKAGVVAVSTGNHGRGLAYAAKQAGVRCIVCMSELVPGNKKDAIASLGAEVRIIGRSQDDAQVEVDRLVEEEGMVMVPPFDHKDVIAGQGTLGLELLEKDPEIDSVVVPLSGGGLISGVALACRFVRPDISIIGVSMERGCAMYRCLEAGRPVSVQELPTLADALGGGIGLENRYTFPIVRENVDEVLLVSEEEIAEAIRHAYWEEHLVVEGSGAVGLAAILSGKLKPTGKTVLIVSGNNIDMNLHMKVVRGEPYELSGS